MRRLGFWIPGAALAALVLALWGVWTWRLGTANRDLALTIEAQHQRDFNDMAYHVEQIQSLLGKGLATGTTRQNMRYMSEVYHHAMSAVNSFTALPLPAEVSASTGKFLQQTGDFAVSLMRNEAAEREMDEQQRAELVRLRTESSNLSAQLQGIMAEYNKGGFRWSPPVRLSWAALMRGPNTLGKPMTQDQAPASMLPGGWDEVGAAMGRLPVMVYDGPFSDHLDKRVPAMSGAPVEQAEAQGRLPTYLPNFQAYQVTGVQEVNGNLPAYSFRLAPKTGGSPGQYTTVVEVTKNGGFLLEVLNSRMVGKAAIDLNRARTIGQEYLASVGYKGMSPTYGQAADGTATIAYAYQENGVIIYPDQIKVKIALDNGEILAVDARQYLMSHHTRNIPKAAVSPQEAQTRVNPDLAIERVRLAMIPNQAGTGELLTYEFLGTMENETFLVYINAETGAEEQILQQVETDGGTFAL